MDITIVFGTIILGSNPGGGTKVTKKTPTSLVFFLLKRKLLCVCAFVPNGNMFYL